MMNTHTIPNALRRATLTASLKSLSRPTLNAVAVATVLTFATALFSACTGDEIPAAPGTPDNAAPQQITIQADLATDASPTGAAPQPGTRMDYLPDGNPDLPGLKTTWTPGDAFNIVPLMNATGDGGTPCLFTLTGDGGTAQGSFTGNKPDDSVYDHAVYHPATIKNIGDFYDFAYSGQVQTGNDDTRHLTAYHSIETHPKDYTHFSFAAPERQSSCMKLVLTLPDDAATPSQPFEPVLILLKTGTEKRFFSTNQSPKTPAPDLSQLSLQLKDISLQSGDVLTAYLMMSAQTVTLSSQGIELIVVDKNGKGYRRDINGMEDDMMTPKKLAGGKLHSITAGNNSGWSSSMGSRIDKIYTPATQASNSLNYDVMAGTPGSADAPYQISSAADLKFLQGIINGTITGEDQYKNKQYKLTADLIIATGSESWEPIGTSSAPFSGTFDGDGYSITGLYINTTEDYQGLFGFIKEGTVKNLRAEGRVKTSARYGYVGGIAGYSSDKSYIIGCTYSGGVESNNSGSGGGICGNNGGYIIGCGNTAQVTGNDSGSNTGGIAGKVGGSIIGCYNTGTVRNAANNKTGGITGYSSGKLSGCYNTGDVIGSGGNIGGIIGLNYEGYGLSGSSNACLWVKGSRTTATQGCGTDQSSDGNAQTEEIASLALLNEAGNIAKLNDAIKAWNSDAANGAGGDTDDAKYCNLHFEAVGQTPTLGAGAPD